MENFIALLEESGLSPSVADRFKPAIDRGLGFFTLPLVNQAELILRQQKLFHLSAYGDLAAVSSSYSPPMGRFHVLHLLATKVGKLVGRSVKHTASVHPEPGSNSPCIQFSINFNFNLPYDGIYTLKGQVFQICFLYFIL